MAWFRKSHAEVSESRPTREEADQAAAPWIDQLARPCVRIDLGPPAGTRTTSVLGATPYLPVGTAWPTIDGEPAQFVCQVNFAEVPPLPGFPTTGLLQWFVAGDKRFEDDAEDALDLAPAPACRWYADPSAETWEPDGSGTGLPFGIAPGTSLTFRPSRSLPSWEELPDDMRQLPVWQAVADAYADDRTRRRGRSELRGYEGLVRNQETDTDFGLTSTSMIGGYADGLPEAGWDGQRLIMQLFTGHLIGYADGREDMVGELWGDPGDLSQLYHTWY